MEALIILWLVALTIYAWISHTSIRDKMKALDKSQSSLFWALKNKQVIDVADLKEGVAVMEGKKIGYMGLKDFIDMAKK